MQTFSELEREGWGRNAATYDQLVLRATRQAFDPILGQLGDIAGKTVVDLACGTGHLAGMLSGRGARTTGVDFAPEMIALARRHVSNVEFIEADCEQLPFNDSQFDAAVCCFGALHFERPDAVFAEVARILKPGGQFVFTVWRSPAEGGHFLGLILKVYEQFADLTVPLPPGPPLFELTDVKHTMARLTKLNFEAPLVHDFDVQWIAKDAKEVSDIVEKGLVRTRMILDLQRPERRKLILAELHKAITPHVGKDGFAMINGVRLFTAVRY
jgi:ubiquinone/menaquinone biosynthesis C-methylase UbiE